MVLPGTALVCLSFIRVSSLSGLVLCLVFGPNLFFLLEGTFQRAFELHNHGDELERYA